MQLSILGAAFGGFGFIRRHPKPVLVLTAWAVLVWGLNTGLDYLLGGDQRVTLQVLLHAPALLLTRLLRVVLELGIAIGWSVALHSAIIRSLTGGPAEGPMANLRFRGPEWRLLLVYAIVIAGFALVVLSAALVGALVIRPFADVSPAVHNLLLDIYVVLLVIGGAVLWVRFCLAPFFAVMGSDRPLSQSWRSTPSLYWRLFLAYVINAIAALVIATILTLAITIPLAIGVFGVHENVFALALAARNGGGEAGLGVQLTTRLVQALLVVPVTTFTLAPAAAAYRLIEGEGQDLA